MSDPTSTLKSIYEQCESDDDAAKTFVRTFGEDSYLRMVDAATSEEEGAGTPEEMSRSDFDGLPPEEKRDYIQGGGKVVD